MAYSLYFFVRDICGGDFVAFLEKSLDKPNEAIVTVRDDFVATLSKIYNISHKIVRMVFSELLIATDPARTKWAVVGESMVAVDTLVHKILDRTGILSLGDHLKPAISDHFKSGQR